MSVLIDEDNVLKIKAKEIIIAIWLSRQAYKN
jgi:hypothetical protein